MYDSNLTNPWVSNTVRVSTFLLLEHERARNMCKGAILNQYIETKRSLRRLILLAGTPGLYNCLRRILRCSNSSSKLHIPHSRPCDNSFHLLGIYFPHIDNPLWEGKQTLELFREDIAVEIKFRIAFEGGFNSLGEFCGMCCGEDDLYDIGWTSKGRQQAGVFES